MAGITLDIDLVWEEQPGDGSLCKCCSEPIFYKSYVQIVVSGPERSETNRRLCESCYNLLDNE
jgi:hypothetical protein